MKCENGLAGYSAPARTSERQNSKSLRGCLGGLQPDGGVHARLSIGSFPIIAFAFHAEARAQLHRKKVGITSRTDADERLKRKLIIPFEAPAAI